jgi:hypothetical protein
VNRLVNIFTSSRRPLSILAMPDVIQTQPEKGFDMVIVQAVENLPADFAAPHQPHLAQASQMVGDGRLADPDGLGQGPDVHFAFDQG